MKYDPHGIYSLLHGKVLGIWPYSHVCRGSVIIKTFEGLGCRRRANRYVDRRLS